MSRESTGSTVLDTLLDTVESVMSLLHECWTCVRDPLCYRPPKSRRSSALDTQADNTQQLLCPLSTSAVNSTADLDTEHHADVLQQQPEDLEEPQLSFHSAVNLMKKDSPFYRTQVLPGAASIELKDTPPNLLLGQYHLEHRQRQFVAPHPGTAVRRAPPEPLL